MSEDITSKTLPGGSDIGPSGSNEAVADAKSQETNKAHTIAKALSAALGKPFTDDETALKSVKDTYAHVGRVAQYHEKMKVLSEKLGKDETSILNLMQSMIDNNQPAANPAQAAAPTPAPQPQPAPSASMDVDTLARKIADREFFDENPQFKAHKPLLEKMRGNTNQPFDQLVKDDVFQGVIKSLDAQREAEQNKSVLHNENARLNQSRSKMDEASEAIGNKNFQDAADLAVGAVVDSILASKE